MSKKDLITQDNALINASYSLELVEKRLILLAIARSRKTGKGITAQDHLEIYASDYAECFNVERQASYMALKSATESLFNRYFTYGSLTEKGNLAIHKSRWTADIAYVDNESKVKLVFSPSVVPFITDLEKRFTSYFLDDVSALTSTYAIRLYELIIAWRSAHKTPIFELAELREKLGIAEDEYQRMFNFKKRVLDIAISQINDHTNIFVKPEQHKRGRSIYGFSFNFVELQKTKPSKDDERDPNTVDWVDEQVKTKPKRKHITEHEAAKLARPGEEWPDLLKRIGSEYHVIFDKKLEK
ncbi:replication initiation protein RepM [Wohlfahrtiimonas chitiniclastica]|uniref:replication initiation protein RepM n=1 Tax=Wohlfahrtiimonas chitiniclastica TaxID=400946 RepID=UPI000B994FF8|nr:replication initiation protein RepM [Wohlfahrtiimonas chitiniclastica]MBS7837233.1 replication initiation protein RepM [Wohlfahrtiimonas chitiniclastica]OYQ68933.1 Replication protein [Wohlfahrtiimonas chitiniclastica]OYQ73225.1 Replication protein [Wohlfahrtiimonas chitiniclastica]